MNILIDKKRLWKSLMEIAKIGPGTEGGNNRQALTLEDSNARNLFVDWCKKANLETFVDDMGNIFAERKGKKDVLPVYMGSHLDTQPTGGKFDGVLGVLGALEVIRTLNDLKIETERPLVIVNWTNEEGTRFSPPMMSSGVFSGQYEMETAYQTEDNSKKKFVDELIKYGWKGQEPCGKRKIHSFFELHIEQGPILEKQNKEIGIVVKGQGLVWLKIIILGKEAHSGSTPMDYRKDAGLGFTKINNYINDVAMKYQPDAVATVGKCSFFPNSPNIIPGKVEFIVDLRSSSKLILKKMQNQIIKKSKNFCSDLNLQIQIKKEADFHPVHFDDDCIKIIKKSAEKLGYSKKKIISGAGHDAFNISKIAPTGMIMCPCKDGLSHNEKEDITIEWAEAGTNVLLHSILSASNQ